VTINDLLGEPDSFGIIIASQFDTILDVAVWPHDVGAIIWHGFHPTWRPRDENILQPLHGGRELFVSLRTGNFFVLAQATAFE